MKHTSIRASDDIEITKAWIKGCFQQPNNWNLAIELPTTTSEPPTPRVIGLIGAVRAPEIGYMLNASHWGHGYATEALRAFMPLFFEHFSGHELASHDAANHHVTTADDLNAPRFEYAEALTDTELVASHNVLTKAGFKLHEKREKDFENPVLGWRDTLAYRMYRPDAQRCVF
ncbi:hypothetical protein EJ02DRAFT_458381 [Clathrospora elynae]|uniref:N-acetyltransferase domain-containing protein n=1 Tax=Clathrospora elynae TaxID=706981 RepID=A0A6A5SB47_9PLEO|nr:hypothetical protein EJ02DRAFT_458381 [Clathrospora elynae]